MTLQDILKILINAGIEPNEASVELKILLEHFAGYTSKDIILGNKLTQEQIEIVKQKADYRAQTRMPIQYITGTADFMGEKFKVNSSVLIPRDETELLVRTSVDIIKKYKFHSALDIGTGSGCIACMIAKLTNCQIIGIDISSDALNVALDNASYMNLYNKAIFRKSDIFSNIKPNETFDIIISNPPYIPPQLKANIQREVSFEPNQALYTKDDKGLEFYKKIISQSPGILNKNGFIAFEMGFGQSDGIKQLLITQGFKNIEIIKDLSGIERVITAQI